MESIRIPLRGRTETGIRAWALIDLADYEEVIAHNWFLSTSGYAVRNRRDGGKGKFLLHREILGLDPDNPLCGDHINGDTLDNRRSNLRVVTHAENMQNMRSSKGSTSEYRGVSWNKRKKKWIAQALAGGKNVQVGAFTDELEAHRAVVAFRLEHMPYTREDAA